MSRAFASSKPCQPARAWCLWNRRDLQSGDQPSSLRRSHYLDPLILWLFMDASLEHQAAASIDANSPLHPNGQLLERLCCLKTPLYTASSEHSMKCRVLWPKHDCVQGRTPNLAAKRINGTSQVARSANYSLTNPLSCALRGVSVLCHTVALKVDGCASARATDTISKAGARQNFHCLTSARCLLLPVSMNP